MQTLSRDHTVTALGPDAVPALTIDPGEKVLIETARPLGIRMRSLDDPRPPRQIAITGPIAIRGAHAGDALRVTIHDITLPARGKVWTAPWLGVLKDIALYERELEILDGVIAYAPGLNIPVRPMVGFVGVAPSRASIDCLAAGEHGGNMDTLTITSGSTVVLPVTAPEALLAIGDVHAAMGEGEVIGIALEVGAELTVSADLVRQKAPPCPMVETDQHVAIIVTEPTFDLASQRAVRTMTELLSKRRQLSREDAYGLVGLVGDLRISQNVNPYGITLRLEVPKAVWAAGDQ